MSDLRVKICELCGEAYASDMQMQGASITADVFQQNVNIYRENYEICLSCLRSTGLENIFLNMHRQKRANQKKVKVFKVDARGPSSLLSDRELDHEDTDNGSYQNVGEK